MANKNKSFLTEAERSVLTPNGVGFPQEARKRFFEWSGNIEVLYTPFSGSTRKDAKRS